MLRQSKGSVLRRPFLQGRFIYMGESYTPILVKSASPRRGARTHSGMIGEGGRARAGGVARRELRHFGCVYVPVNIHSVDA